MWRGRVGRRAVLAVLLPSMISGAAITAVGLTVAGELLRIIPVEIRASTYCVTGAVTVFMQVFRPSFRFPNINRQIPRSVFDHGAARAASQFGFELGLGWRTKLTTLASQLVALGVLMLHIDIWSALAVGFGFAVGRYLHLLFRLLSGLDEQWDEWLQAHPHLMTSSSVGGILLFSLLSFNLLS